ncbi:lytic transglycosylase [Rouxiella silvae]|uniref:peptidoglycan lytic exotransglycosylase n=1 Tax=Rouxiella silvae TaxID=1646373 RepID=A0ABX3TXQ3_9GAMM|nr:transglycosylase SLT domain-containing protein [Rouxiella silvae]ORJ20031.1 lytic transglycosylase [Rouxiella silvae]
MNAETIKDFLVSLGFQVDDAGAKKFDSVLAGVTTNVFKMAGAVEAAAGTVMLFTTKIAAGLDNLYWASQRTGASVAGIKALGYAASQTGSSAEAARGSLESLSRFMRNNPGAEGFLNRLGVQTRDASGNMRDMSSVFTGVGQQLSKMPYYRANQYAEMFGIDENTLMAMRRGLGGFNAEYSAMAKAIGYNADQAAVSSNKFMTSLRDFGAMAGMARDKIGSTLANGLAGSIDNLRKQFLENFPKIEDTITRGVNGLLWLAGVIGQVIYRLIQAAGDIRDWWGTLDKGTKQLIETFGGLILAWRILNSAFVMSPIGMVTLLVGALIALYDDYKTWKEGGKSLIDWGKWKPEIDSALDGIDKLWTEINRLKNELLDLFGIDPKTWSIKFEFTSLTKQFGELTKMLGTISDIVNAINEGRWSDAASLAKKLMNQGGDQPDALPGVTGVATQNRNWLLDKYFQMNDAVNRFFTLHAGNDGLLPSGGLASGVKRPQATAAGSALLGWLSPTLDKLEALYHLPAGLLKSVAITESAGNPNAVSGVGAQGLFQLMPGTAKDLGLKGGDAFDPVKSAQAAAKYLAQLMKINGGDLNKALASYNWGVGNVQKYGMALMPQETRNYVPRVMSNMPGVGTTISQETNIHVHGVSDPVRAGQEVAQRQTNVNSRLTQQTGGGAS